MGTLINFLLVLCFSSAAFSKEPHWSPPSGEEVVGVRTLIKTIALEEGLEPYVLDALIRVESAYDCSAISSSGAQGCAQLKPLTVIEMGVKDPFNPEENIRAGARYLLKMYRLTGDLDAALAAYNVGLSRIRYRIYDDWPEQSIRYLERIKKLYPGGSSRFVLNDLSRSAPSNSK